MNPETFELFRDRFDHLDQSSRERFDTLDGKLDKLISSFEKHTEKDETYWKKIDRQHAQLRLIKWVMNSSWVGALAAWFYQRGR